MASANGKIKINPKILGTDPSQRSKRKTDVLLRPTKPVLQSYSLVDFGAMLSFNAAAEKLAREQAQRAASVKARLEAERVANERAKAERASHEAEAAARRVAAAAAEEAVSPSSVFVRKRQRRHVA